MIGQFAKRPASRHKANLRPITGQATEQSKRQSNECFQMAKKHMTNKQYDQAMKHYTNATIHNPSNFKALCNMGTIYKERAKFPQARSCYHKALFANPFDPITLYNLANLQRVLGDDELAIAIYTKVTHLKEGQNMDIGSLYYDAYLNQGICYKNLQLYDQAIACNDKAIQISPNDQSAYFNKSMCLIKKIYSLLRSNFVTVKKKLCQQAETTFKKVLGINPNNFTAKMGLVQLKYLQEASQQNLNDAVKEFQVLQKSAPDSEKFELSLKIKYCKNQLRKIDESKIILPPKQDIIQVKDTVNKYDNQNKQAENKTIKLAQSKRPESKKQSSAQNKREKKQPQQIPTEIKQQLEQGKSIRSMIDKLLQEKKFEQAFDLSQKMPDGMEKYEAEIIINYSQCVEQENDAYLESAISIYNDFVIKDNENTPITKQLCSEKAHEVIATMLTVYGIFEQASKHYQVLLQIVQDQKLNKARQELNNEKLREIHAQLGICYAERGLLQEAISQYRKSLQMQPDNYFLMTNLCGLLIQDGHKAEARKYYQTFLAKNGGENMSDKVAYIDSLLNISISVRDTQQEWQAINKAVQAIEKYFPTIDDIKQNLHQQAILGLYLRQVQIFEQKAQSLKPSSPEKRQLYEKMLDAYLTCLQFDNCPDRQAICINSGILFYLNGCYANALSFYKNVVVNKKIIANNVALTLLHMHEYERGANWLQIAIQDNPENVVYAANFEIVKWMCGMGDKIIQKYNCQCESMYETRVLLGLWMIDELTLMIDQNQISIDFKKGSKTLIKGDVEKLIDMLLEKAEKPQKLQGRTPTWKTKSTIISKKLQNHIKQSHSTGNQGKSKQLVPSDMLDLSLKVCKDVKEFQENFTKILDYLNSLRDDSAQFSIIQSLFSLPLLVNNHIPNLTEITKALIQKKQIQNTTKAPEMLESAEFKSAKAEYIEKKVQIDDPSTQLNLKVLQTSVQDAECMLENAIQFFLERIQTSYYANTENILSPLNKEYSHPHCENSLMCIRCVIGTSHLYSSIFCRKIKETVKIGKNWSTQQQIQSFNESLQQFTSQNLQNQVNNVFSKKQGCLTVRLEQKQYPIILKAHLKTFQNASQFLKSIDKNFSLSGQEKSQKGVRLVQINKSLMLEIFWGQNITALDRFCHWMSRRSTNYVHDSVLFLGQDLKELQQLFQQGPKSIEKIKTSLYSKP